jgi:hypothetical protein
MSVLKTIFCREKLPIHRKSGKFRYKHSENGEAVHVGKGLTEVRSLNRRTQTGHEGSGKKRANLTPSDSREMRMIRRTYLDYC